jgi:hypothetical protein
VKPRIVVLIVIVLVGLTALIAILISLRGVAIGTRFRTGLVSALVGPVDIIGSNRIRTAVRVWSAVGIIVVRQVPSIPIVG